MPTRVSEFQHRGTGWWSTSNSAFRSVAALACWLACSGRAQDVDAALARLRRVQPRLALDKHWLRVLREAVA